MEGYAKNFFKFSFFRNKEKIRKQRTRVKGGWEEKEDVMLNRLVQKTRGKKERLVKLLQTPSFRQKVYRALRLERYNKGVC